MDVNNTIIKCLTLLNNYSHASDILSFTANSVTFTINNNQLLAITPQNLLLNNTIALQDKITPRNSHSNTVKLTEYEMFIKEVGSSIVRLNHVGINYYCQNIEKEVEAYKEHLKNSSFNLYQEDSGNSYQNWFFVGNASVWDAPLVEVVLTQGKNHYSEWIPHFQIDIDTTLSIESLREITTRVFGTKFLQWELDIPQVGVVLAMGILGEVQGVKLVLGVGTNLRDTQYHREHILQVLT